MNSSPIPTASKTEPFSVVSGGDPSLLPTMYNLPSEDPKERSQRQALSEKLQHLGIDPAQLLGED